MTVAEKLRRKDLEVARALEEKQRLIAEILNVPLEDFEAAVANDQVSCDLQLKTFEHDLFHPLRSAEMEYIVLVGPEKCKNCTDQNEMIYHTTSESLAAMKFLQAGYVPVFYMQS